MIRPILITGGSGFVGSYVVAELARLGLGGRVHLLMRKHATPGGLIGLRLRDLGLDSEELYPRTHLVDLQDEPAFLRCLDDLSSISSEWVVIHLAAVINPEGDLRTQEEINFNRTRQLLNWTNSHGKRFVFISSVVAFGATPRPIWRTESDYGNYHFLNRLDGYSKTKREAQDAVLKDSRVGTVVLCPGIIHGSYEHLKTSRGHLQKIIEGTVRWLPGGGGAFVSLEHVGEEIIKAATEENTDENFSVKILADVCMPYIDYFQLYRESAGLPPLRVHRLPGFLVWPVALAHWLLRICGREVAILGKLLQSSMYYYFQSARSLEEGKAVLRRSLELSHKHRS